MDIFQVITDRGSIRQCARGECPLRRPWVGLELDEFPVLAQGFKAPLVAGQIVAIEPKFLLPGLGAIGIENTFAVGDGGGIKITDLDDGIVYL